MDWFFDATAVRCLQLDFVWGFAFANPLGPAPDDRSAAPALRSVTQRDLSGEARRVKALAAPMPVVPSDKDLQKIAIQAVRFAEEVGEKDDRRVVEVFRSVLNAASGAGSASPDIDGPSRFLESATEISAGDVQLDDRYVKNALGVYPSYHKRIVGGQPTTGFRDCVAVGSASGWCCTHACRPQRGHHRRALQRSVCVKSVHRQRRRS